LTGFGRCRNEDGGLRQKSVIAVSGKECYSFVMRDKKQDSAKEEVKVKVKDDTKTERMVFNDVRGGICARWALYVIL